MHLMSVWQRELMHPSPSKTGANRKIGIFPTPLPSLFRIGRGREGKSAIKPSLLNSSQNRCIPRGYLRDMFRRSYRFHFQGLLFTLQDTHPAAETLFRIDSGFEFLGSGDLGHFYGVEHTAFYTGLAAVAEILVHFSLKAALFPHFSDIGLVCVNRVPDHATINTAVAHHRHSRHPSVISPVMHQAVLFDLIHQFHTLFIGQFPACPPDKRIFRTPVEL